MLIKSWTGLFNYYSAWLVFKSNFTDEYLLTGTVQMHKLAWLDGFQSCFWWLVNPRNSCAGISPAGVTLKVLEKTLFFIPAETLTTQTNFHVYINHFAYKMLL